MKRRILRNSLLKDQVTVLKTGAETSGEYILLEVELGPGGGIPLHYHRTFSEEYAPVDGLLGLTIGRKDLILQPGARAKAFSGEPHRFFNPGREPIRFLVKMAPASESFLQSLSIGYGLANDGLTNAQGVPRRWIHVALLMQLSDTWVPGVLAWTAPLVRRAARRAAKKGITQKLIGRYYG